MDDSPVDSASLPAYWSPAARDAVEGILSEHPDLTSADLAALEQAAELVTFADAAAQAAREAGNVSTGSAGQLTAHPLAVEARHARADAASIFARIARRPMTAGQRSARARRAANARYGR
jgi:hypothetical protein